MIVVVMIMMTTLMKMITAKMIMVTTIMIMMTSLIKMIMETTILTRTVIIINLVPRAFLRRGEGGWGKTLTSADHVITAP